VTRAYEQNKVVAEYYSSLAVTFRYLAGALGIPFMPIKSMMGSDLLKRLKEETAPDNVCEMDDPFTGEHVVLVKALQPDVAVLQVQMCDAEGNARIYGPRWENAGPTSWSWRPSSRDGSHACQPRRRLARQQSGACLRTRLTRWLLCLPR
jgi:hypothetical protein